MRMSLRQTLNLAEIALIKLWSEERFNNFFSSRTKNRYGVREGYITSYWCSCKTLRNEGICGRKCRKLCHFWTKICEWIDCTINKEHNLIECEWILWFSSDRKLTENPFCGTSHQCNTFFRSKCGFSERTKIGFIHEKCNKLLLNLIRF